jgi:hypothetical protein
MVRHSKTLGTNIERFSMTYLLTFVLFVESSATLDVDPGEDELLIIVSGTSIRLVM